MSDIIYFPKLNEILFNFQYKTTHISNSKKSKSKFYSRSPQEPKKSQESRKIKKNLKLKIQELRKLSKNCKVSFISFS